MDAGNILKSGAEREPLLICDVHQCIFCLAEIFTWYIAVYIWSRWWYHTENICLYYFTNTEHVYKHLKNNLKYLKDSFCKPYYIWLSIQVLWHFPINQTSDWPPDVQHDPHPPPICHSSKQWGVHLNRLKACQQMRQGIWGCSEGECTACAAGYKRVCKIFLY